MLFEVDGEITFATTSKYLVGALRFAIATSRPNMKFAYGEAVRVVRVGVVFF